MPGNLHCKEPKPKIGKKIFPEKELRCHSPNVHIHVSVVIYLYIPMIDLPILQQEICWPIPRDEIYNSPPRL